MQSKPNYTQSHDNYFHNYLCMLVHKFFYLKSYLNSAASPNAFQGSIGIMLLQIAFLYTHATQL